MKNKKTIYGLAILAAILIGTYLLVSSDKVAGILY